MKKYILIFITVVILLSIYPTWRYFSNAKIFANTVLNYASNLGQWTNSGISTSLNGKITVRNPVFTPNGYSQGMQADSMIITAQPMFLLKNSRSDLQDMLPENLTVAVNSIQLNDNADDLYQSLRQSALWKLQAGFAGSFGCSKEATTEYDTQSWEQIISTNQVYNFDLYYSRQNNGSIDTDITLDAENMFTSTWSGNLKSGFNDKQIVIRDLLVDKLYYYYLDYGFNKVKNKACSANYKGSYAAYRSKAENNIQEYLRTNYLKELPKEFLLWFHKSLQSDVEYNAIFEFAERQYLNKFFDMTQVDFLSQVKTEIGTTENDYMLVELAEVDYTKVDTERLKQELEQREEQKRQEELKRLAEEENKMKPIVHTIGGAKSTKVPLNNISTAIGKRVRIKTWRGRPVIGYLLSVENNLVELESIFRTGRARISVPLDKVSSVEIVP